MRGSYHSNLNPLAAAILQKNDPAFQARRGTGKISVNLEHLKYHPEIQQAEIQQARRPTITAVKTEAALIIVRVLSDPPQFVVIKDIEKSRFGFPFGGRELGQTDPNIFDRDLCETAVRETIEEIFFGVELNFDIEVTDKNFIGKVVVQGNHIVYIFWIDVPADAPVAAGEEQEAAFTVPLGTIYWYIDEGMFLPKHSNAIIRFERFCEKQGHTPLTLPPSITEEMAT